MAKDGSKPSWRQKRKGKWQISLLALLLGLGFAGSLGGVFVIERNERRRTEFCGRCLDIDLAIVQFHMCNKRIPKTEEGLEVLCMGDPNLGGPYLDCKKTVDAWGNEIAYRVADATSPSGYILRSFGPDGRDDGGKRDDLISSEFWKDHQMLSKRPLFGWLLMMICFGFGAAFFGELLRCREKSKVSLAPEKP